MAPTKKQRERIRGVRRGNRHERRQQQHAGGSEWDCIRIPEGIKNFKPEAGKTYHLDVIPYIVGSHNKNAEKGDEYFELSYAVYSNIGLESKRFIAIGEMLGVPDPIAEQFATLRKQGADWEDMKMFKPTWRQIFLIFVHEESENGLQFFEGAYGAFGELLDEELAGEETDYIDNFDDPEHGSTLEVRFKSKNIGKAKPWILASKINFIERENGFTADGNKKLAAAILDQASEICLDDCLKIVDYDMLKSVLDGRPMEINETPSEEKKKPKTGKETKKKIDKNPSTEEEFEDDWEFPEEPEEPQKKDEELESETDTPSFDTSNEDIKTEEKSGDDEDWDEDW
jgi:hypothetical protein